MSRVRPLAAPVLARAAADRATWALALAAGLGTAAFFTFSRYPIVYGTVRAPLDIVPGAAAQALSLAAPVPAGLTAALCVVAPWPGLLAVLVLSPWFDAAQVGWWLGPLQVLGATWFVVSLLGGLVLRTRWPRERASLAARMRRHRRAFAGGLLLLCLATASTVLSPEIAASGPVWLHGVVEPLVLALLVLLLVPDRRGLGLALLVLGLSAALAGLINLAQTLPTVPSALALQDRDRAIFSRLTYFNVGLFGEVLAMAIPLLAAALVAPRWSGAGRWGWLRALVAAALALSLVCLYLTFSKSGWLAAGIALLVLALAWLRTWRARGAVLVGALIVSMLVAPWPLVILRPVAAPAAAAYEGLMTRIWGAARLATWDPSTVGGEVSITERVYASSAALRMAADHPLLGVGLDRFKVEYAGPYRDPRATMVLDSAHDLLPNLAAEVGLPFALLVAAAMAAALVGASRVWRDGDGEVRPLAAGLGAALVAWWIVSATFDPDLYRTWRLMASDIIFAAVLVALGLALPALVSSDPARPSAGSPAGRRVGLQADEPRPA